MTFQIKLVKLLFPPEVHWKSSQSCCLFSFCSNYIDYESLMRTIDCIYNINRDGSLMEMGSSDPVIDWSIYNIDQWTHSSVTVWVSFVFFSCFWQKEVLLKLIN